MISVERLVKRYGAHVAVDDVSFDVDRGEVVGFLGPNGAGKTTTLRIVAGFLGLTSGCVTVCGHDIVKQSFEARQRIGYMPEAVPLYPEMRVAEYLAFRAELKRVARRERPKAVHEAMTKANVVDVPNVLIGSLSKGYRQRVGLADALVARPPLLVLDEPTAGLDPNQIREVRSVVRALGEEHTVFLSTHILGEVEATCSRVVVIAKGKLVAAGTVDDLAKKRRTAGLRLRVRGDEAAALRVVRATSGVADAAVASTDSGGVHEVRCTWEKSVDSGGAATSTEIIVRALVESGCAVREATPVRSSLEEVFAELTRDAAEPAPSSAAPPPRLDRGRGETAA